MQRPAALGPGREKIPQSHVGEGAAHHHLVIAAARAVGVEIRRLDAVLDEVTPGRAVGLDCACGRDVIGGDAVAEQGKNPGTADVGEPRRLLAHAVEVRRVAHVGGIVLPFELTRRRHRHLSPAPIAGKHVGVARAKHVRVDGGADGVLDLPAARPDVAQVDGLAVGVLAERIVDQVESHVARDGVGDDQRWRGEEIHAHVGVNAALEVTITREHRAGNDVGGPHRVTDRLR